MSISDDRVVSFHAGQVWESPRGSLWRVVSVERGKMAVLKQGERGLGRKTVRDWDAVVGWVLHSDAEG